ncbi:hypothetical protein [Deinococcus hopiensis]|uniref:Uncharacterized protein n=1 Tax=Deinococcus hopiensis KR-140 TaxID=695939 RepID=A0A1W1UZF0_9DEIO|nr:hypothetical protein [Deinococcus hopiensis]SMB86121.1 hypothetical protein SAMN00790413_03693 [Deinococcus hopiensis KR-140]
MTASLDQAVTAVLALLASRTQMRAGAGGVNAGPFGRIMVSSWQVEGPPLHLIKRVVLPDKPKLKFFNWQC